MPTYAYRWADGTVSLCHARNKDHAMDLFDEVGDVSRSLIIRLKSDISITMKLKYSHDWQIDEPVPLNESLEIELLEKCYPMFDAEFGKCVDESDGKKFTKEQKNRLRKALLMDQKKAEIRLHSKKPTLKLLVHFPKGLPGQNN